MSARGAAPPEFLRAADTRLPDGDVITLNNDPFIGHPAQRVIGPALTPAQLYRFPAFRDSAQVIHVAGGYAQHPVTLTLFALNYTVRISRGPFPVMALLASNTGDGRLFTVEFRRGGHGYDTGIGAPGTPAGLVVHSINPDGRIRYEGVAAVDLANSSTDWASAAGDFALRLLHVDPSNEFVQFTIRGGARLLFPIRGSCWQAVPHTA